MRSSSPAAVSPRAADGHPRGSLAAAPPLPKNLASLRSAAIFGSPVFCAETSPFSVQRPCAVKGKRQNCDFAFFKKFSSRKSRRADGCDFLRFEGKPERFSPQRCAFRCTHLRARTAFTPSVSLSENWGKKQKVSFLLFQKFKNCILARRCRFFEKI